jgi:protein-S-isoprenylcysteine O-methyltransferase Ste14
VAHETPSDQNADPATPEVANLGFLRPPLIFLAAILLGLALGAYWPLSLGGPPLPLALGGAGVLAAISLFASAVRTFRAANTPVPGNRPTTTIVRSGPYRLSRNPIYLSFALLQLGLGLCLDNLWLLLMLWPSVGLMSFVVIPREERYLEARFPAEYSSYKGSTRRWL